VPASSGVLPTEERWWSKPVGLAVIIVVLAATLPLVLLALPFLAIKAWLDGRKRRRLQHEFHAQWGTAGKCLLLVYSNSPHWQAYIEENWLPRLGPVAVVLNWSERARWPEEHPLEAEIFRMWAGDREFNPVAIVLPEREPVRVIRFWQAFRDYKHGKDRTLKAAEAELADAVGVPLRADARRS
jgi:hypothetical protein